KIPAHRREKVPCKSVTKSCPRHDRLWHWSQTHGRSSSRFWSMDNACRSIGNCFPENPAPSRLPGTRLFPRRSEDQHLAAAVCSNDTLRSSPRKLLFRASSLLNRPCRKPVRRERRRDETASGGGKRPQCSPDAPPLHARRPNVPAHKKSQKVFAKSARSIDCEGSTSIRKTCRC